MIVKTRDLLDFEGFSNLLTGFNKEFICNNIGNYLKKLGISLILKVLLFDQAFNKEFI